MSADIDDELDLHSRDAVEARIAAQKQIEQWGYSEGSNYHLLQLLCGVAEPGRTWIDFSFTKKHLHTCQLLIGEHGYAVFRALATQHNINLDNYK